MYCMESGLDGQFQEVLTGDNDGLVAGIKQSIDGQLMSKWFSPADWGLGSRSAYLDAIQIIVDDTMRSLKKLYQNTSRNK